MYFVYILECKDKSLYTGITTDVARRFLEHKNKKGGHYTASHPVLKIVRTESFATRSMALKREVTIKAMNVSEKHALIKKKK